MARRVIRISKREAASDFASLLVQVRAGAEIVIEDGAQPIAVVRPAEEPKSRLLSEALRIARQRGSTATLDENFANDVLAAIQSHLEPLEPPAWD